MAENGVSGYGNVTTQFTILVVSDDGSLANDTSNIVMVNNTTNVTWSQSSNWNPDDLIFTALTSTILGILIFATVVGNVFVIAAILLERHLHSVANYLIVSLAVADLLVACLVMPLGAVYEISRKWILGPELCDMWTSSDVLCCTASILHLVAIAVDRYWAVTNIDYIRNRNIQRIGTMIFLIWTVALVVSIAPLFGWKDPEFIHRVNVQQRCLVSQDVAYQVFATCATFYVPLTVILILYWKIFQTARRRIRRKPGNSPHENRPEKSCFSWSTIARPVMDTKARKGHPPSRERGNCHEELPRSHVIPQVVPSKTAESSLPEDQQQTTAFTIELDVGALKPNIGTSSLTLLQDRETRSTSPCPTSAADSSSDPRKRRETLESKREKKAAKTLAIITGAFVVCWMPFFTCALLMPLCPTWEFNETMLSVFLWLGYFNSTLNPIIYTIFSPEFRQAFQRLLCGRPLQASVYRPRKLH